MSEAPRPPAPPALARLLLALLPGEHRDYVVGDLEEEFTERVQSERGFLRPRLWFWGQALRTLWAFARRRPAPGATPRLASSFLREARRAGRALLRRPGTALLVVPTLAVGVGAVTSVFTLADAILLKPLPGVVAQSDVAVARFSHRVEGERYLDAISLPNLRDLGSGAPSVSEIAGDQILSLQASAADLAPRYVEAAIVTGRYFALLGVVAARGRLFTEREADTPGAEPLVVVSDAFRRRVLGADPDVVGRTLRLNGTPFTVIGVASPGFRGPDRLNDVEVWVGGAHYAHLRHLPNEEGAIDARGATVFMRALLRLRPGASREQAQRELRAVMARLVRAHPDENADYATYLPTVDGGIGLGPGTESIVATVRLLAVLVLVILAVACANVAGLLVLRGVRRQGETAMRRALGAARAHLVAYHLAEALLLAAPSMALGLAVALTTNRGMWRAGMFPDGVAERAAVDPRAFAFAAAVAVLTALLFGGLPATLAARVDVHSALKEAQRTSSRAATFLQGGLIVVQLSLAVALVGGALLLHRTLANLDDVSLGFEPRGVLAFHLDAGPQGYDPSEALAFHRSVLREASAIPGVEAAAEDAGPPFVGVRFAGRVHHPVDPSRVMFVLADYVSEGLFDLLRIPVLAGRGFTPGEAADAPGGEATAAVLSLSLARMLFGTPERAVGRLLETERYGGSYAVTSATRVVGVVDDVVDGDRRRDPRPRIYYPQAAAHPTFGTLLLRTSRPLADVEADVRGVLDTVDPAVPLFDATALSVRVEQATAKERTLLRLSAILSVVAVLLAAVGLYAVVAYAAAQRRREFGIRLALGATGAGVTRLVVGHALAFGVAGVACGVATTLVGRRLLSGLVFGVGASDPSALGTAGALLVVVAVAAALTPALRAARLDPASILRSE